MSSVFNEALERASNPQMPPPKSPLKTPTSPSRTSVLFQDKIRETVVTVPGPSSTPRPSTPRPIPDGRDVYASGALPPLSLFPSTGPTGLHKEIPIPTFRAYTSNYPPDEVDWSEPTPRLPPQGPSLSGSSLLDAGPCRNFRDPQAAANEERERHFAAQRQRRLEKLVSASDALHDAPALPAEGPGNSAGDLDASAGPQEFDSTVECYSESCKGEAGEIGSVYVPGVWRRERVGDDDVFSDVAEDGGETDDDLFSDVAQVGGDTDDNDDEEQWDAEFARAEEEVGDAVEGGYENAGREAWAPVTAEGRCRSAGKDTAPAAADAAAVPYVKHTPITAMRDWAYPAASSAPSPTESQLMASGFEFHNELSEEEQIARFGDKAFRKALREVLPSLSRKQQWYAWRRVNEEGYEDGGFEGKGATSEEVLKEEIGECECRCPGNGEECEGDDGTCGKLLNECRCGDCGDCDEHYRWHHPDGACETEGLLGEEPEDGRMPKCVCGKVGTAGGERQPVSQEQDCLSCKKTYHVKKGDNGEPDTFTSACGCGGDERNCQCSPNRCACKDRLRSQTQYHRPVLNPEVAHRPSDWTGLFSQGRLIDGEPPSTVREGLDLEHDVPAPTNPRIPGLGLLDPPSDPQLTYETIRHSVEPETPRRQLHRESTPAFEDRSPSPSPMSHKGNLEDVEMTDAPSNTTSALQPSRLPLPQPTSSPDPISSPMQAVTAPQTPARPRSQSRSRSRSPAKAPVAAPDPLNSTPKSTKRGGRRKSAVQGSKVEKTSTTKSRAVSRKVTAAVKNAAEKAGSKVKEAVARIEASVKGKDELTPRRSARIRAKLEREGTPKE